jgi:hypothetical protein
MWPAMAARSAITIRYYLWADDGPWRLPVRLHQDLIAKKVALPQYAGTKQKILEVFARWITSEAFSLKGRGGICTFDADGFMEHNRAEELVGWVVERAQQKLTGGNLSSYTESSVGTPTTKPTTKRHDAENPPKEEPVEQHGSPNADNQIGQTTNERVVGGDGKDDFST